MALKKQSNSTNTERLTIRVSEDFINEIKQAAKDKELSVSTYVRMVIKQATKKNKKE